MAQALLRRDASPALFSYAAGHTMTHKLLDETGFYSAIQAWTRAHAETLGETAGPLTA